MKKRILIFSPGYLPGIGGAEIALKEITDRLTEYEFEMITAKMDISDVKTEQIGNVLVHRIGFGFVAFDKIFLAVFGSWYGMSLHKKKKFDAVWSLMASYGALAALSFTEKTGVPFLLTLQEGDPIEETMKKTKIIKKRFQKVFTSPNAIHVISTYLQNWALNMGFGGKNIEVIPNGVEIARFTEEFEKFELEKIRKDFGFVDGAIVVVTTSRLVKKNGVEDVIRALPLLSENVCFVICGVGGLESQLKDLVKNLNLENRVRFLGNKSHHDLPKILKASDIFIRPSLSEGLGNSFLEAMAAGLPTIGTPVGGIPDFLVEDVTGFLCLPENPKSIADAIKKVIATSGEKKKIIHENSLKIISEKYNWDYILVRIRMMLQNMFENK